MSEAEQEIEAWTSPLADGSPSVDEEVDTRRYPPTFTPPEAMAESDAPPEARTTLPSLPVEELLVLSSASPSRTPTLLGVGEVVGTPAPSSETLDTRESAPTAPDEDPVTLRAIERSSTLGALVSDQQNPAEAEAEAAEDAEPVDSVEEVSDAEDMTEDVVEEPNSGVMADPSVTSPATASEPIAARPDLSPPAPPAASAASPKWLGAGAVTASSLSPSVIEKSPAAPPHRISPMRRMVVRPTAKPDRRPLAAAAVVGALLVSAAWWVPPLGRTGTGTSAPNLAAAQITTARSGPAPRPSAVAAARELPLAAEADPQPGSASAPESAPSLSTPTAADREQRAPRVLGQQPPQPRRSELPSPSSRAAATDKLREAPSPVAEEPSPQHAAAEEQAGPAPQEAPLSPFNHQAATSVIARTGGSLHECVDPEIGRISVRASVTFMPSGRVSQVTVDPLPVLRGSPMVGCIVRQLRQASVSEFAGERVTVSTIVTVE